MFDRAWIASIAVVLTTAASAPASFIDSIVATNGTHPGQNADLTSWDFTDRFGQDPGPVENVGYVGPGASNENFADLTFDVLRQDSPFNVLINRVGGPEQAAEYWFEVTLHNATGRTIDAFSVNLLRFQNRDLPAEFARFDEPDGFNSSGGTFSRISDSFAIFSGLGLHAGNTQTLGFSLDFLADLEGPPFGQNTQMYLQFAATPEPHVVLLGGMCLLGFIAVLLGRQRSIPVAQGNSETGCFASEAGNLDVSAQS